jgi:hypothetical protein
MKSNVTYLNNLSAARKAEISARNENQLRELSCAPKNGSQAILGLIPNCYKSEWHMFAPANYLAMLDKMGISLCIRFYPVNDNARDWANEQV